MTTQQLNEDDQGKIKERLALNFLQKGKIKEAEDIYRELISEGTTNHTVYVNLAAICIYSKGNINEIINLLNKSLIIKPNYHLALHNLAKAYKGNKDLTNAISYYKKAIRIKPSYPESHYDLGVIYHEKGKLIDAISSYKKAIDFKPSYHEAHYNLGNAYKAKGDLNLAINSYQQAIKLNPSFPEAYNNLGNVFKQLGCLENSIDSYKKSIIINPKESVTLNNIGNALLEIGDIPNAINSYEQALELNQDFPAAHYNLGIAYLLNRQYKKGWVEHEYRLKRKNQPIIPHAQPKIIQWQGEEIASKEQLLVISEQGLGDTIQFMRYIPFLRQKNIDISLCAQPNLHGLIYESDID